MAMQKINLGRVTKLNYYSRESYKALRTNIQFCGSDIKTILFTSCVPREGKSSTVFNLAVSLAESGKKVIIIDADLRKSVFIGRYKVSEHVNGLSHYLAGQNELNETICDTNIPNLHVMVCTKYVPNPAELLGGERFETMVEQLKENYDYVLIDSPPLGSVIDAAVMAPYCDGAAIIVSHANISYRFVQDVKKQIEKSGCKILGAVLNKVPIEKKGQYGKYYGKYYGHKYEAIGETEEVE